MDNSTYSPESWLDVIYKISVVAIFVANLGFQIWLAFSQGKRESQRRNLENFKEILVVPNIEFFYSNFIELEKKCKDWHANGEFSIESLVKIDDLIQEQLTHFRNEFIELFFAADRYLYYDIIKEIDLLQENLSSLIGESAGIRTETFNYEIENKIMLAKTRILETVFKYEGERN